MKHSPRYITTKEYIIWTTKKYCREHICDVVQTKMPPSISFSGTQQKQFLLCSNRTNSWCRAHMYFTNCFFPFVRCIGDRSQYYKIIFNTHMFSNVFIMTLNYVLCPISVQNPENVHFEGIYLFSLNQHTAMSNITIWLHSRYITFTHQILKYRYISGVGRSLWRRLWLWFKSYGFSNS